jgi:hypothetical protein
MAIGFLQHDNENRRMATTCDRCLAWQVAEVWELKAARSTPFSSDFVRTSPSSSRRARCCDANHTVSRSPVDDTSKGAF